MPVTDLSGLGTSGTLSRRAPSRLASLPPHHPQGGGWASPPFGRRLCTPRYSPPLPKCDAPLARRPRPRQPKRLHLVAVGLAALSGCYFRNIAQVAALFLAPFFSGAGSVGFGLLGGRNPGLHACNFRNAFRTFVNLGDPQLLCGRRENDGASEVEIERYARCWSIAQHGATLISLGACAARLPPCRRLGCTFCTIVHTAHTASTHATWRPDLAQVSFPSTLLNASCGLLLDYSERHTPEQKPNQNPGTANSTPTLWQSVAWRTDG